MSEIPEDIKAKAWSLLLELNFHEGPSHQKLDMIEAAILAENERCAKIADERMAAYRELMDKTRGDPEFTRTRFDVYEHSAEAVEIVADRIRRR